MKILLIVVGIHLRGVLLAQDVVSVTSSSCDYDTYSEYLHPRRLIGKWMSQDTLTLQIGVVANCSFEPVVNLLLSNDTMYIDIENKSEVFSACNCCYELIIKSVNVNDTSFLLVDSVHMEDVENTIQLFPINYSKNKYRYPTPEELSCLEAKNLRNEHGQRIGAWHIYDKTTNHLIMKALFIIDFKGNSIALWKAEYSETGELKYLAAFMGYNDEGYAEYQFIQVPMYFKLFEVK